MRLRNLLLIPLLVLLFAILYVQLDERPVMVIFVDTLGRLTGATTVSSPEGLIPLQNPPVRTDASDGIDPVTGRYEDRNVSVGTGVKLPIRIFYPVNYDVERPQPYRVFVWFHGGGWATGSYQDHDYFLTHITNNYDEVLIFSVEYRLAPQHKFPTALNDCWDHLVEITKHAKRFNIDASTMVIGGESAGGNIAAVLSQRARTDHRVQLAGQYLCVPVANYDINTDSYKKYGKGYILSATLMEAFWDSYTTKEQRALPEASPLREKDLTGLPPALVHVCEFDILKDDGLKYANRMISAGVPVKVHEFVKAPHGSISHMALLFKPISEEAALQVVEWLKSLWGTAEKTNLI